LKLATGGDGPGIMNAKQEEKQMEEKLPEVIDNQDVAIADPSPMALAQNFLKAGGDLASLEKMMVLQEKFERREAEKAFYKAMAEFKKHPPKIFKDRHVDYTSKSGTRTQYDHASLANIVELICTELSKHGLSADWDQKQDNNQLTVTCYMTHELGFSKRTSLTAPPDTSGGKNGIQGLGSTNSYLQRYTLLSLTGLATHDQDNDGAVFEPVPCITVDQATEITDLLKEVKGNEKMFVKNFNVETIEAIPGTQYGRALNLLNAKKELS